MIKLLIFIGVSFASPSIKDSLGVETINGKLFVIHKVDEKETLYAISRRYRTSVDEIVQYNSGAEAGLEIGQILKVPYTPKVKTRATDGMVHQVAAKETLFSISKKYGVSMEEIIQWNNLTTNALSIGQELVIKKKTTAANTPPVVPVKSTPEVISRKGYHTVGPQETMFSIARQYGITVQQLKDWNKLEGSELKIGQSLFVAQPDQSVSTAKKSDSVKTATTAVTKPNPPAEVKKNTEPQKTVTTVPTQPIRISESIKNGSETVEAGLAELIEGTEGNRKYLALHRTAPVGTILKIKNEMNNREVFVRVMGKLPDTALTDKLIIRISKSAYDRLGAIDQRFRVEVTYYK